MCVVEELLNAFRPLGCKARRVSAINRQGYRHSCTGEEGLKHTASSHPALAFLLRHSYIFFPFGQGWHKAGTKAKNTYEVTLIPNFRGDLARVRANQQSWFALGCSISC